MCVWCYPLPATVDRLPTVYAFEARHGSFSFYILISLPFYHSIDLIKNCPCCCLGIKPI